MAGTITKKAENTWQVRIFLGRDGAGKTKHFNKAIHGSRKDAQTFLNAKLRERDLGTFVTPTSESVSKFLDRWLKDVAKNKLRKRTFEGYESLINSHVRKQIGTKRLSDIQPYDIQRLYGGMKTAGYSSKTVRHVHNILSPAFKQAVRWKMIFQNPCDLSQLPRLEKKEMRCLTPGEVMIFLEAARGDRYYTAFILAMETGMTPEEYLGLQWQDIDFGQKTLSVRRALIVNKGGGFYFEEPKTKQSRRSIPLSDNAIAALKSHRRGQLEEAMAIRDAYQAGDLVFATRIGTPIQHRNFERRHFAAIRDKTNLPKIRLYDLRHTTVTLLLSAGENPKVVSERLGHASIVLTLDTYSHVLPTMQKEATAKIERLMFGT
ncbi:MAG: site-specific integrase [Blastocatellia bacterium]|nr:site-specific integrase [Blastocatellia bacterium]